MGGIGEVRRQPRSRPNTRGLPTPRSGARAGPCLSVTLPAQLRLEQRMVKREGKTMRFAVPVLDVEISPAQLVSGPQTVMVEQGTGRVLDGAAPLDELAASAFVSSLLLPTRPR